MKVKVMKTRVLVVDDELDTLNLLRTILEISGYTPITTLNSVDAVNLAEVEKPDVVLLDIMMPKLDGFTLCKMLRANASTQSLPIIFVTAYEALDIEERRVEAGANKVINKPISMDILIKAIDEVLRGLASPAGKSPASPVSTPAAAKTPDPAKSSPPAAPDGKAARMRESAVQKPDAKAKQESQPEKDTGKGKDRK
jgi:DNA-binding response OmpR family regulator